MKRKRHYSVIEDEGVFVAHFAEFDIANEVDTKQEALANIELYLEGIAAPEDKPA